MAEETERTAALEAALFDAHRAFYALLGAVVDHITGPADESLIERVKEDLPDADIVAQQTYVEAALSLPTCVEWADEPEMFREYAGSVHEGWLARSGWSWDDDADRAVWTLAAEQEAQHG